MNINIYIEGLERISFHENLVYIKELRVNKKTNRKRKQARKIIWSNHLHLANIKTSIGKTVLKILHGLFPCTNAFHNIFTKNKVKLSYSCMHNMDSVKSFHNRSILNPPKIKFGSNCRDKADYPQS